MTARRPEGATPRKFAHGAKIIKRPAGKRTSVLDSLWPIAEISLKSNGKSVECSRLAAAINLSVYDFNNLFATLIGRKGCPYS